MSRQDNYNDYDEDDRLAEEEDYEAYARRQRRKADRERYDREAEDERRREAYDRQYRQEQDPRYGRQGQERDPRYRQQRERQGRDPRYRQPQPGRGGRGDEGTYGRNRRPPRRRRKRHHPIRNFLIFVLVVLLVLGGAFYALVLSRLKRVNSAELESTLKDNIADEVKNDAAMDGYTNIALFGVDSRTEDLGSGNNRSDTIMIASINNRSGEIRLVSVYRDTVMDIGGGNYQKCNAAYAYGGASQAVNTLNVNLDMNITDYVTIGFEGLADVVDAVGGIDLEVTEEERKWINAYQQAMQAEDGMTYTELTQSGNVHLNGTQATAYCRIRYTTGDDFKRTSRQRTVLTLVMAKAKKNPLTMVRVVNAVADKIATSLSNTEILRLIMGAWHYSLAETDGFPQTNALAAVTYNGQSCVVAETLSSNVAWLHSYLFGEENYTPSRQCQERSQWISYYVG